ncbi:mandelate racemase/muconate lactonizing enzyme family protein [Spirosoma montaniterrae]|uniref:Mandelate racemase/muconate lactonizing enzyme C-terminal domain-containing protein n=1 Tax=Spirosoma montaniterrae TaxID=1178516 RepID=A0A1P9WUR5_9BACT|nr:mandelate racemase/muconate lactonizing enzyme family protein [Spirosoma montaniterrae]AQG79099.1 hypothetical protein AWR27_07055 [Spirosoma montaniterrae]
MSTPRRHFLKSALLAPTLPALTGRESAPAVAPGVPLKIKDVRTIVLADRLTLVQIFTDQGVVGFGECSPMSAKIIAETVSVMRDTLLGEDPRNIEYLWERLYINTYKLEGRSAGIALSGIDLALWDILGKVANLPVHNLMGGAYRSVVPVYSTLFRESSPENMARRAQAAVASGFTTLKLQVATRWGFDAKPDTSIAVIEAVRKAVGDQIDLVVDANSGWSVPTAIRRCRDMEPYRISWLEQPTPERDLAAVAEICRATDIPMGFGEEEWSVWRFKDALVAGAADILQPDPIKSSGLTGCKKVAVLAEAFSKTLTPHNTSRHLGMAATLHLIAASPNARSPHECTILPDEAAAKPMDQNASRKTTEASFAPRASDAEDVLRRELLTEPFVVRNSALTVPTGSGLGVKLNVNVVKKYASGPVDITEQM